MTNWIEHPVILEGHFIKLVPLDKTHFADLIAIGKHPEIWMHLPFDGTESQKLLTELQEALLKRMEGSQYAFTILCKEEHNRVIGSTRLFDMHREHRKVEIGWTWNDPAFWGKGYNIEAKLLLLTYCFEVLGTQRVQLKTRDTNLRSQSAIVKIGARFEGVMRKDRIAKDGSAHDSYLFSIIDDEWPDVKKLLTDLVSRAMMYK